MRTGGELYVEIFKYGKKRKEIKRWDIYTWGEMPEPRAASFAYPRLLLPHTGLHITALLTVTS